MIKGTKTAVARGGRPSSPLKEIIKITPEHFNKDKRVLDYGCGRGEDAAFLSCEKWDPHWFPEKQPEGLYDTILCTYVLCVVEPEVQESIIKKISGFLKPDGTAFISVRDDIKDIQPGRGCDQRRVDLEGSLLEVFAHKKNNFKIFKITKGCKVRAVGPCDTHGLLSLMNEFKIEK